MRQALHIFAKDVRRLWPQIAALGALFAVYAFFSPETTLANTVSLLEWNGIPAALVVLGCWTLGASAIHEDGPAQESPFWLTRPYGRISLVGAKVFFLLIFVFVPLVIAGVVLEMRAGAGVFANSGNLLELSLVRSLWLILPALSLGVVTRNLLDFAGAFCASWFLLEMSQMRSFVDGGLNFARSNPLDTANVASLLPMTVVGIAVIGLQFALRHTVRNRWLIAAGILLSGVLLSINRVEAFSRRVLNPSFNPKQIQVTFDRTKPALAEPWRKKFCAGLPLKVEGLPKNTILHATEGVAELTWSGNWPGWTRPNRGDAEIREAADGYRAVICLSGPMGAESAMLRTTVHFDVIEVSPLATIRVTRGVQSAGDRGRCEIVEDVTSHLRCTLTEPVSGAIAVGLEYPGYRYFTRGFGDIGTFRLSPVLRRKFDGVSLDVPGGWPFDAALKRDDAHFVLRKERVIGSVWRTFVYEGYEMPWGTFPSLLRRKQ